MKSIILLLLALAVGGCDGCDMRSESVRQSAIWQEHCDVLVQAHRDELLGVKAEEAGLKQEVERLTRENAELRKELGR